MCERKIQFEDLEDGYNDIISTNKKAYSNNRLEVYVLGIVVI